MMTIPRIAIKVHIPGTLMTVINVSATHIKLTSFSPKKKTNIKPPAYSDAAIVKLAII